MKNYLAKLGHHPPAEKILVQYIQAVGGAAHLAEMKSYVATGSSAGFGGFGKGGQVEIIGKFPDQRATSIMFPKEPARGHSIRAFGGLESRLPTPLTVLTKCELTGTSLAE